MRWNAMSNTSGPVTPGHTTQLTAPTSDFPSKSIRFNPSGSRFAEWRRLIRLMTDIKRQAAGSGAGHPRRWPNCSLVAQLVDAADRLLARNLSRCLLSFSLCRPRTLSLSLNSIQMLVVHYRHRRLPPRRRLIDVKKFQFKTQKRYSALSHLQTIISPAPSEGNLFFSSLFMRVSCFRLIEWTDKCK